MLTWGHLGYMALAVACCLPCMAAFELLALINAMVATSVAWIARLFVGD